MSVGKALLRVRQEKGLTQSQVAERAGLATSYVSRIENDRVRPTMVTVKRLADSMGIPLSVVFQIEETGGRRGFDDCPVSSSGECIGGLIRSHHGRAPKSKGVHYGKEELRLLKMTDFLVTRGPKHLRRALTVVLESFVNQAQRRTR